MDNKLKEKKEKPVWEIIFPYILILVFFLGLIFLLLSVSLEGISQPLALFFSSIGLELFSIGVIALIFEWLLQKHQIGEIRDVISKEIKNNTDLLVVNLVENVVSHVIKKAQNLDIETLRTLDNMKTLGFDRLISRSELEISEISFKNVVNLLKNEKDNEFFILGKTLEFISKQINTLSEGLKSGINFKLALIDTKSNPWDTEVIKMYREKAKKSIDYFKKLVNNADDSWEGTLEVRKTKNLVENSFSSFSYRDERISVLDLDLGEDTSLQCSQIYKHQLNERNFAYYLYKINKEKYQKTKFVLSFPLKHKYVYIYGIRREKVLFLRKKGSNTWELPGGTIENEEIPEETALREYMEETGYHIELIQSIDTKESNKLVFIGKIKDKVKNHIDSEIEEIKFFKFKEILNLEFTYPNTSYNKILSEIDKYIE